MFQFGKRPRVDPNALVDLVGGIRPLLTLAAVLLIIVLGALTERAIRKIEMAPDARRRALRLGRAGVLALLLGLLLAIWGGKLRSIGLVLSGFAVALVIAARELIRSTIGWWMKAVSRAFKLGDRVAIGDLRGIVIDQGVLTTTLLRTDPNGDDPRSVVTIANSQLLTKHIENESRAPKLALRTMLVTVPKEMPWRKALAALETASAEVWQELSAEGVDQGEGRYAEEFAERPAVEEPLCGVGRIDKDGVHLELKIALPREAFRRWQERILRRYLELAGATLEGAADDDEGDEAHPPPGAAED